MSAASYPARCGTIARGVFDTVQPGAGEEKRDDLHGDLGEGHRPTGDGRQRRENLCRRELPEPPLRVPTRYLRCLC